MKNIVKAAMAGAATLAIAGGGLMGLGGAAHAAVTQPAWEPDPLAAAPYGNLVFYDTAGNVVTSGTNLSHLFDYAAATTGPDAGATKANLIFAAPNHASPTSGWYVAAGSASTTFPNAAAPAPLGSGFANPVVSLLSTDGNLSAFLGGAALDTTAGYANVIQVRVKDSGAGGITSGTSYWESDIAYNNGTSPITVDGVTVAPGTWDQLYPQVTATSTTISASPTSPQANPSGATAGQNVTLTATVSPASGGSVQFLDGSTALGSAVAVSGGTASTTVTAPAFGTHTYSAKYIPTGGTEVQGSTSSPLTYVVNPPQTGTTTSLAGPSSATQYSSVSYTATMTTADSTTQAGSVAFNAAGTGTTTGSSTLGTVSTTTNTATLNVSSLSLAPGTYNITATFTPTSNTYATSTSAPVALTVSPTSCPGAPDPSGGSCSTTGNVQATVSPGSLTITTPYSSTKPFVLPALQLDPTGSLLQASAQFPAPADGFIAVHSSLGGNPNWTVSVSDSDLACSSGACTTPVTGEYQKINGENLGLTGGNTSTTLPSASFPGTVSFPAPIPAAAGVAPSDPGTAGLKGGPHTFAKSVSGGDGSVSLYGTLSINVPTATQPGTYTGTITFTVG